MSHPPRENRSTVRSEVITLRLSPAELEALDAVCEALGLSRSDAIRLGLRGLPAVVAHLPARCEPSDL